MRIEGAYFEITNLCNLNCITCYNRSGLNLTRHELSLGQIQQMIQRLATDYGCKTFSFAGGEPCLHSEFSALLAYLKEQTDFQFSFVTNGTVHNQELIDLFHSDPDRFYLQISLDGSCEDINCLTRGVGSFAKSIAFLDQVATPTFRPRVKMVISQKNLDDIEPFFHMVIAHGGTPDYAFINCNGNAVDDWENKAVSPRQKIQVLKRLDRLNQDSDIKVSMLYSTSHCPLSDPSKPLSVLIKSDGSLQPCQLLYDQAYSFGNLLTDTKEQIEAGALRVQQLAQERKAHDYQCHRCMLREQCGKGCMAIALYNSGDPLGLDGECLTRKLEIADFELLKHPITN